MGGVDCNLDSIAGGAAAHGWPALSSYNFCLPSVEFAIECCCALLKEASMICEIGSGRNYRLRCDAQPGGARSRTRNVCFRKTALPNLVGRLVRKRPRREVKIELEIVRLDEIRAVISELLQHLLLECDSHRMKRPSGLRPKLNDGAHQTRRSLGRMVGRLGKYFTHVVTIRASVRCVLDCRLDQQSRTPSSPTACLPVHLDAGCPSEAALPKQKIDKCPPRLKL